MDNNLIEFLKVFIIVFGFSGLILTGRHFMLKADLEDSESTDDDNILDFPRNTQATDAIDYDGMGNYGRFPIKQKKDRFNR